MKTQIYTTSVFLWGPQAQVTGQCLLNKLESIQSLVGFGKIRGQDGCYRVLQDVFQWLSHSMVFSGISFDSFRMLLLYESFLLWPTVVDWFILGNCIQPQYSAVLQHKVQHVAWSMPRFVKICISQFMLYPCQSLAQEPNTANPAAFLLVKSLLMPSCYGFLRFFNAVEGRQTYRQKQKQNIICVLIMSRNHLQTHRMSRKANMPFVVFVSWTKML